MMAIKNRNAWKKAAAAAMALAVTASCAVCAATVVSPAQAQADTAKSIKVVGVRDNAEAKKAFDLINQKRKAKGLDKLKKSARLTKAAMQRAGECAVFFGHNRPDGSDYTSAITLANYRKGTVEHEAAGYTSAEQVTSHWLRGGGSATDLMGSNFGSVGIGSFVSDGTSYWVVLLGNTPSYDRTSTWASASNSAFNALPTVKVSSHNIKGLNVEPMYGKAVKGRVGERTDIKVSATNNGYSGHTYTVASATLTSSDASVASVVKSTGRVHVPRVGYARGKKAGTATIKATLGSKTASFTLTVKDKGKRTSLSGASVDSIATLTRTGRALKPSIVVSMRKGAATAKLRECIDYRVMYTNNVVKGRACATLVGIGDYKGTKRVWFDIA